MFRRLGLLVLLWLLWPTLALAGFVCDGVAGIVTAINEGNFDCADTTCTVVFRARWSTASARGLVDKSNSTVGWSIQTTSTSTTGIIRDAAGGLAAQRNGSGHNDNLWRSYGFVLTTDTGNSGGNDVTVYVAGSIEQAGVTRSGQPYTAGSTGFRWCTRQGFFTPMEVEDTWVFAGTATDDFLKRVEFSRMKYVPHNGLTLIAYWPMDDCTPGASLATPAFLDRANPLATGNQANGTATGLTCNSQTTANAVQFMYNGIW